MSSVQPESSAKDKNGGKTALASTSDDGDFFSSGAQGLEPKYMRQDSIRSRCALAYIDQLFISTSVHRHKTVEFIGERLAVLCSRYPALAERSARLLLVTLGFYPPLDKKKKDLLDSQTAWKLFNILVRFALSPAHQGSLLLVGSRHIVEHFLYLLTPDLKVREIRGSATLDKFLEQIKTVVSNYESCVLLQRLVRWYDVEEELNKHFVPFFTQFPLETNKYSFDSLLEVLSKDLKFKSNTFDLDCLEHSVVVSKIHSGRSIPSQEDTPFLLSVTICYLARKARCPVKLTVECMAGQANKMIENKLLDPGPIRDGMIAADEDAFTQLLRNKGAEVTEDDGELLELLGTLPMSIHYNYGCAQAIKYMMSNPEGKPVHEMRSAPFNSNVNVSEDPEPGWNGRNFVRASDAEWRILLPEFDCPDLHVNRQSLKVFASVMNAAFPNNTFPVHTLYAPHKYPGTHFNMLNTIIENPDVMCLRAYDHTPVVEPSYGLKTPIDDTDPAIGNWQCLELTCSLLMLAVQSPYHKLEIKRIFLEAAHLCLDVVVLALFRAPVPMTEMRLGLLTDLLSKLILQNTNAAPILNHAWNMTDVPYAKQFKELILFSLASIYTIDDQTKLTKILDIAHELKPSGLSDLLVEEKNLNLVVDLACLASKRSYLNIEKWLEDNFKLHGDSLITTVLSHIQRRYKRPALVTAWENRSTKTTVDPIGILLNFVNQKANEKQRTEFKDIFQVFEVMKESGRSSSVSSTGGRNPIQIQNPSGFAQGPLRQDNRTMNPMANFVPNNPHPPINFPGLVQQPHMMGQPPQPPLPMGNMNSFAQANRDILKNFQPAPPMPTSTSPSNQMLRSQVSMNQRQSGSNSGYHSGGTTRSSGPSTPSSHGQMEYRPIQPNIHGFTPLFQPNQDYPARLQILQPAGPEPSQPFPGDVQSDANTFFEKLYNTENPMPTSELINLMKQLKSSTKERDQLILDCVIENLFEEYRFFHDYPERELRVTAEVYGGIIREGIIEKVKFATGMRKVVEALSSETNSKLFQFGSIVMQNCKTKLNQYPKMCSMIMKMENFKALPQSVRDYVLAGETGSLPAEATVRSSTPVWQVRTNDSKSSAQPKSILSYTNIDTLVQMTEKDGAKIEQPSEAVVDKVAFLFNNLSNTNLEVKKDELLALMKEHGEEFLKWLAQYVVMKRVSLENNFHPMYNMFLICLKSPELDDLVKKETFRNIKILLRTDKRDPSANYSDRTLLKNLGTWLGYITIARNNPIILKEIDLRSLLLEAYYKGQSELLYAVPFISKILHSCSKSKLFPPTCAWIRSILKVLAELHAEPDLKINLRFEIEVLCKELQVDLTSLPCDGVLKDTEKLVRVPQQLTPLRQIARPEVSSPIPQQLRLEVSSQSPVTDTKPSTPQPGSESAEGGSSSGAGQGSATSHSTDATVPVNTTHFAYHDINVHTFEGFYPHVAVAQALPIFQLHPYTKQLVRPALAQAIKELIGPVAERALRIAMTVTENMVKKDFSLDPDENNMKTSAFHMMRAMTAAMAMITCREPLATNIHGYLIQAFQNTLLRNNTMSPEMQKMIDQAATIITQENVELATNFIVKTACEKAAPELDKRLENEYQRRISARRDGTVFKDEAVQAIQTRLPNAIAITPGPTDKAVMNVYEQFSSRICGFKPATEEQMTEVPRVVHEPVPIQQKEISAEQFIAQTQMFIQEIDMKVNSHSQPNSKAFQAVRVIREHLTNCIAAPRDQNVMGTLVNTAVDQLLFAYVHDQGQPTPTTEWNRRLLDLFVSIMRLMRYHYSNTELARRVTIGLINIRSDYKWNIDGIEALLKQNLVQKILWDEHLAAAMEGGTNLEASVFAQKYLRALTGGDVTKTSTFRDLFPKTYEQLIKLQQLQAKHNQQHEPGHASHSGGTIGGTDTMSSLSELAGVPRKPDDAELTGKVEMILREWIGICYTPLVTRNPQEAFVTMLGLMNEHSVLATDDKIADFFRVCIEMCVDVSVRMLKSDGTNQPAHQQTVVRQRCFYTLDAFVKLMALMVRHSDSNQVLNKINLLKRLLKVFIGVLHVDHDVRKGEFNAMPYHRIIISLFNEITTPDAENTLEPVAWSILEGFGQTLFALQPRRLPGFAFAWLDIVGHRHVIGRLLANTGIAATVEPVKTTAMFTQLIISHLKFLAPFLRNIQLPKAISILYKGTLRVLLVILHDFPELLCEYHYAICDTIPPNCVQLRNLVLSAYPRNMRLPDPFALNFKQVDSIPDMSIEPKSNLSMSAIIPEATRVQLDEYLSTRTPVTFLTNLPSLLQLSSVPGQKYNTTVMNAIVLYVGMRAIENLRENRQRISIHTIAHTSYMDIFQNLAVQLCTEGRYLLFNGIANQLRYPNAHTHYFSCVFLFLFLTSDCDAIQEQITRILFERLVALRPHPWGLLITFIELIKNPTYSFWKYEFTRCAPEIERLFQNVANTCTPASSQTASGAGGLAGQPHLLGGASNLIGGTAPLTEQQIQQMQQQMQATVTTGANTTPTTPVQQR